MTQTAFFTAPARSLGHILAAPFKAVANGLIALAEAGPRMQEINRLNALSDAQLAAQGKTPRRRSAPYFRCAFLHLMPQAASACSSHANARPQSAAARVFLF